MAYIYRLYVLLKARKVKSIVYIRMYTYIQYNIFSSYAAKVSNIHSLTANRKKLKSAHCSSLSSVKLAYYAKSTPEPNEILSALLLFAR